MIFTVATSIAPNFIRNRISCENGDGYFLIKTETIQPPDAYNMYDFELVFDGRDERQSFSKTENEDKFIIYLYKEGKIVEENIVYELLFETFIENDLYIIRIKEELLKYIKYDNWRLYSITFRNEKSPSKRTKIDVYLYE
jgi:hypothetical protein